jgi:hypothetical protein
MLKLCGITANDMVHKSSLSEFYGDPVVFTHASWLEEHYPSSLLDVSATSVSCRRLLNKHLAGVMPPPATQDLEVPTELQWSVSSRDQLRNIATGVSSFVFAPYIKKLILKSKIQLITDAIGEQHFQSAMHMRQSLQIESDVFDVVARFDDAANLREFFIDVGWECLLQLLIDKHAPSAWRFRLIGKKPYQQEHLTWYIRCQPEMLLSMLPEFMIQEESA